MKLLKSYPQLLRNMKNSVNYKKLAVGRHISLSPKSITKSDEKIVKTIEKKC